MPFVWIWFLHHQPSMVEVMPGNVRQSTNFKHLSMARMDLANGPTFQKFSLYEICNPLCFSSFGENLHKFALEIFEKF
jgi:hypothetical protein